MPLALESLVFNVETQKLLDAKNAIDALAKSMGNFNKVSAEDSKAAIAAAKAREADAKASIQLAKAKEAETKAALAAAKVNEVNVKTSLTQEAANRKLVEQLERKAAAEAKATAAAQQASQAAAASLSVLERQKSILDFMTQGFSKGQASVMAYAKANGALATELQQLESVLQTQRKLIGGDPFDKSMSGLTALKNQYGEIREAIRQYNADSELTRNQTRELTRDKERIIEKMKLEGASFKDIKNAIKDYNSVYTEQAAKVNSLMQVEKARERSQKDHANAVRNVQSAEERLFATVSHINEGMSSNASLNERAALAVGSYERNLRLAGITGEAAAKKLQAFSSAQAQLTAIENKRMADYVARGVGVQMGDVGVSLASGQNPFIVMIQQGDQIRGLIQQAGRDGLDLANVMNDAAAQIGRSFKEVGIVVGTFVSGAFVSAGKAVYNGLTQPLIEMFEVARTGFDLLINTPTAITPVTMGPNITAGQLQLNNFTAALGQLRLATSSAMGVVATFAAVIGGVFLLSTIAAIKEHTALTKVINLQGSSMGVTTDSAYAQAFAMKELGIRVTDTVAVISEMAKAGGLSSASIGKITEAAVKLRDYGGVAIEETVKAFSELAAEPTKASEKLNEKYNYLTSSIYLQINALEDEGRTLEAAKVAQEAYSDMIDSRVKSIETNLGTLESAWKTIGIAAKNAWDSMLNIGRDDPAEEVKKAQATLAGKGYLQGGLFSGNKDEARSIVALYNARIEQSKKDADAQIANNKATQGTIALSKIALEFADKGTKKQLELNKAHTAYSAALAGAASDTQLQKELAKQYEDSIDGINKKFKEKVKVDKEAVALSKQAERDEQSLIDMKNKFLGIIDKTTEAEQKYNSILEGGSYSKYSPEMQKRIKLRYEEAKAAELQAEKIKVLSNIKDSWLDITKNQEAVSLEIESQNKDIQDQYEIMGKVGNEYKQIKLRQEEKKELNKADLAYEKEKLNIQEKYLKVEKDIRNSKLTGSDYADAINANTADYEQSMTTAESNLEKNRELAYSRTTLKAAQEYDATWREIQSGLSESIYTGLTKGGKEAAKSIRKLIEEQLKKKFIMPVIDVFVNQIMTSVMGGSSSSGGGMIGGIVDAVAGMFSGSSSSSSGTSTASSLMSLVSIGKSIYSALTGGFAASVGSAIATAGSAIGSNFIIGFGSGLAMTASEAAAAAAAAAAYAAAAEKAGEVAVAATYKAIAQGLSASTLGSYVAELASGPIGWIMLVLTSIWESNKAYNQGITWDKYKQENNGTWAEVGDKNGRLRSVTDELSALILGQDWKNSEAHQTFSLGSFSAAMRTWFNGLVFNGSQRIIGSRLQGTFSDQAQGGFEGAYGVQGKQTGSLFSRSRTWEDWYALPKEVDDVLGAMYHVAKLSFINIGRLFEDTSISDKLKSFVYKYMSQDLVGETVAGLEALTNTAVSSLVDTMGKFLLPSIEGLRKTTETNGVAVKETWSEALNRVVLETSAVGNILVIMGKTFGSTFGKDNLDGVLKMSSALVQVFGSTDNLTSSFSSYFGNFYSDAEKNKEAWRQIENSMNMVGITTIPKTREAFRSLVEAQDLNTDSGQKTFYALLQLNQAFSNLTPAIGAVVTQIDSLSAEYDDYFANYYSSEENKLRNLQRITKSLNSAGFNFSEDQVAKATTKQFRDLVAYFYEMGDAGSSAVTALMQVQGAFFELNSALEETRNQVSKKVLEEIGKSKQSKALSDYNNSLQEITSNTTNTLQEQLNSQKQLADSYKKIVEDIQKFRNNLNVSDMNTGGLASRYSFASTKFSGDVSKAATGDLTAMGSVTSSAQDFLNLSKASSGSKAAYAVDYAKVLAGLDVTEFKAQSESEKLQTSIDRITVQIDSISSSSQSSAQSLMSVDAAMTALLQAVRGSASTGVGADTAVVEAMNKAGNTSKWVDTATGTTATDTSKQSDKLYVSSRGGAVTYDPSGEGRLTSGAGSWSHSDLIREAQAAAAGGNTRGIYNFAWNAGITLNELDAILGLNPGEAANWARANNLPTFATGGKYQGGLAMVGETGPELINFSNPGQVYTSSQTSNILDSDNSELLTALINEVTMLRAEARATAIHTARTSKILDRAIGQDDSLNVSVIA